MLVHKIFLQEGVLFFWGENLATLDDFKNSDRCLTSVFEALKPGEKIKLVEGIFELDKDLDPIL